mgnify:CR=1 FL=1
MSEVVYTLVSINTWQSITVDDTQVPSNLEPKWLVSLVYHWCTIGHNVECLVLIVWSETITVKRITIEGTMF